MQSATGSAAPIGDMMMILVGDAIFGAGHGRYFMLAEAVTVFLALIGTTLSCMNTAARVTYAMGKDNEVPEHFGLLHDEKLTPHRAIWILATISAVVGVVAVSVAFGDGAAPKDADIKALPQGILSSVGYLSHDTMASLPNTLLMMTLASNFGTFLLYMLSCVTCLVAFHNHPMYNPIKHLFIPIFGLLANLGCMLAYLVLPFLGFENQDGAVRGSRGIALIWAIYGGMYFLESSSKKSGRTTLVEGRGGAAA